MLREIISNEWFTVLIVLCLGILCLARLSYPNRFSDFIGLIFNSNYLKIYSRDQKFIHQFDALLFINLIISAGIFLFFSYDAFISPLEFNIVLLLKIIIAIAGTLLIKVLVERLIGSVFDIDEIMDTYLFQKTNFRNYMGLMLLVFNIILIFGLNHSQGEGHINQIISVMWVIIVLLGIIGFSRTLRQYQKLLFGNLFYFILYLCALEFGPYIILYKVLN